MKSLVELLDRDELQDIFQNFSTMTRLTVSLRDLDGNDVLSVKQNAVACICGLVGKNQMCFDSIRFSTQKAAELGEPYIYTCGCGLVMSASAVLLDEMLLGAVLCGPAMLWDADEYAVDELESHTVRTALTDSDRKQIAKNTLRLSCEQMTSASRILFRLVNYMCKSANEHLAQRREISKQQATIALLLSENKRSNAARRNDFYSPENEKELLAFVRLGDRVNAKKRLNVILADIFLCSGKLSTISAKVYELMAFLVRTASEAKISGDLLIEIARESYTILDDSLGFEELCYTTTRVLENFIDVIFNNRQNISGSRYLTVVLAYLSEHYHQNISLTSTAEELEISSSYLAHLFQEGLNTTFTKTLTKFRMDAAKQFLSQTTLSLAEIAEQVGYSEESYFIRVFKKTVGLTPMQYRKHSAV